MKGLQSGLPGRSLVLLMLSISWQTALGQAPSNGLLREVFNDIQGMTISNLRSSPKFPDAPDEETFYTDGFDMPVDAADFYGQRVRGYVLPQVTGSYVFEISGDDNCELYLSTDDSPDNARLVANVPGWTSHQEWGKYPEQTSSGIRLNAGEKYYIEALMKEQGGGDSLTVRWRLPNGQYETPIPNRSLEPWLPEPPAITSQPRNTSVQEGQSVTFEVEVSRASFAAFQWYVNDESIPGADQSFLTLDTVSIQDNGNRYRVDVVLPDNTRLESNDAVLSVRADTQPPVFLSVSNLGDQQSVSLTFSEMVDRASAENTGNYSIVPEVAVRQARLLDDGISVLLLTDPLQAGREYRVTVQGIRDTATIPNTMGSSSQTFTFSFDPLGRNAIIGQPEERGPSTRISGLIISEFNYNPAQRQDGKNLEFVEIYNTEEWDLDLGGFRLSGEIDFVFPEGTTISRRNYLVVAADPTAVMEEYELNSVLGPWEGTLTDGGGRLRLRDRIGGVMQEINYRDSAPWPMQADGTGHSLVMARPSYGENDPRAWRASNRIGGAPGSNDTWSTHPHQDVVINEIFSNSPDPQPDYVELYNFSSSPVDLGGCILTDDPSEMKFTIPAGTSIEANGHLMFDETKLGFALSSSGESVFLYNPAGDRVIDAIKFPGQPSEVSYGRYPDGADVLTQLDIPSPERPNRSPRTGPLVINEIMFHPIKGDPDLEFIEIHNRTDGLVGLGGWKIRGDVTFTFPARSTIPAGGFAVITSNMDAFKAAYPDLDTSTIYGNFNGRLSNSGGALRLLRPEIEQTPQPDGTTVTRTIDVLEDEVRFLDGDPWPELADGMGSSLELINPDTDNSVASSWKPSRESHKSEWKEYSWTGRLDNGTGSPNEIQLILLGAGECLVDDIQVTQGSTVNRVRNHSFESGLTGWTIQGTHTRSKISEQGQGAIGNYALHLVASSGGDNGANRIESDLSQALTVNQNATISAKIRWLNGHPDLLFRTYGNYGELSASMETPTQTGTPGAQNSQQAENAPPNISLVSHSPVLPRSGQTVTVRSRVEDLDRLSQLNLKYRVHPSTNYVAVPMEYRGAGFFEAQIPGQSTGRSVGFMIEAVDAHRLSLASSFPSEKMLGEAVIRFGESQPSGTFGHYHVWVGPENLSEWTRREKLSNELVPVTFVYGSDRVIYNAGGRYRGSPFIRPGAAAPDSNAANAMVYRFKSGELLQGSNKINLDGLEPGRDDTSQRERTSFWIGEQLGISFSYQRYIRLYVNGTRKSDVFTDSMQPDDEYVERWYPGESDGDLYKIDDWFEFTDGSNPGRAFSSNARLTPFTTTGGALKKTAYRWMWEKKPLGGLNDDYSTLLNLVQTMNASPGAYTGIIEQNVDVDQWMRTFATRHIVGDWDGYGYNRGKNQSTFKPVDGKWKMLLWDLDFSLGGNSDGPNTSMYNVDDPVIRRFYNHPPFERAYLRAWQDAVDGPLSPLAMREQTNKVFSAFSRNGINAASPSALQSWVASRRSYLIGQLRNFDTDLNITTNSGNPITTEDNSVELRGTAPVKIHTLLFNGSPFPVDWISPTTWRTFIPLGSGANDIQITGIDYYGNQVAGESDRIVVNFTGTIADPAEFLTINEIHYNPLEPGLAFLELHNHSSEHAFNLDGLVINGLGYEFKPGSVIQPLEFLVLAADAASLSPHLDAGVTVFDEFPGNLDNGGETITLLKPGTDNNPDIIIDQVKYDDQTPWPLSADGTGPSLQLISPDLDNRRAAHWFAAVGSGNPGSTNNIVSFDHVWKYDQSGNNLGTSWIQPDFNDSSWESGEGLLYVESSALPGPKNTPLDLGNITYYFRSTFEVDLSKGGEFVYSTIIDDAAVIYVNGTEIARPGMPNGTISASTTAARTVGNASIEGPFSIPRSVLRNGINTLAVEVHQTNSTSSDIVWGMAVEERIAGSRPFTPGKPNVPAPTPPNLPPLWINEVFLAEAGSGTPSWAELYHDGSTAMNLAGVFLSDDPAALDKFSFPASPSVEPGSFPLAVFGGGNLRSQGVQWPVPFTISEATTNLYLSSRVGDDLVILDVIDIGNLIAGRSYGSAGDGGPIGRVTMVSPTPGSSNSLSSPEIQVFFTEWMAANTSTLQDPADSEFPDWFELFNAGSEAVDLSGFFLSDDPADVRRFRIPDGISIGAREYMVILADAQPGQSSPATYLHVNFQLSSTNGESLILANPAGAIIDRINFPPQTPDISEGRLEPNPESEIGTLAQATPGKANNDSPQPEAPPISISSGSTPGSVTLSWQSTQGVRYRLLVSPAISPTTWSLAGEFTGDGSIQSQSVQADQSSSRFYILVPVR